MSYNLKFFIVKQKEKTWIDDTRSHQSHCKLTRNLFIWKFKNSKLFVHRHFYFVAHFELVILPVVHLKRGFFNENIFSDFFCSTLSQQTNKNWMKICESQLCSLSANFLSHRYFYVFWYSLNFTLFAAFWATFNKCKLLFYFSINFQIHKSYVLIQTLVSTARTVLNLTSRWKHTTGFPAFTTWLSPWHDSLRFWPIPSAVIIKIFLNQILKNYMFILLFKV